MKYFLFEKSKKLAVYVSNNDVIYFDNFPKPKKSGINLKTFDVIKEAESSLNFIDNHIGQFSWEISVLNEGNNT